MEGRSAVGVELECRKREDRRRRQSRPGGWAWGCLLPTAGWVWEGTAPTSQEKKRFWISNRPILVQLGAF